MNNINIGTRLRLSFGIILLALMVVAGIGWHYLSATRQRTEVMITENNVKIALSNRILHELNLVARSTRNYILYTDPAVQAGMKQRIDDATARYQGIIEKMTPLVHSDASKQLLADMQTQTAETLRLLKQVVSMVNDGKRDEAPAFLLATVQKPQDTAMATVGAMIERQEKQTLDSFNQLQEEQRFAVSFLIIATILAVTAASVLAWAIARSITGPINQAVRLAETVAAGDLTHRVTVSGKDEVSLLLRALASMTGNLATIVGQVRAGTDTITTASHQIAAGNQDLSSRTEQQASSLEETASSMEQLTSTVKQNTENAQQANILANAASAVAVRGGDVVAQVVTTMGSINQSSKKIVDIIGVIDSIAFQTNILALNAAVEAARAGEQGRGFAVVASEVRNLAQRSASAAKEIKELIDDSVQKVDLGSKLVDQAGTTMGEIVEGVKRVTEVMMAIALASNEQNAGIEQINQAISQMDQVTQQNAALVEQAAAAAESMQEQSGSLARVVGSFTIDAAQHGSANAVARPAPTTLPRKSIGKTPAAKAAPVGLAAPESGALAEQDDWQQF